SAAPASTSASVRVPSSPSNVLAIGSSIPSTTTARSGSSPSCSAWSERHTGRSAAGSNGRPEPRPGVRARASTDPAPRSGGGCGTRGGSGRSGRVVTRHLVSALASASAAAVDGVEPATDAPTVPPAVHSPGRRPQTRHPVLTQTRGGPADADPRRRRRTPTPGTPILGRRSWDADLGTPTRGCRPGDADPGMPTRGCRPGDADPGMPTRTDVDADRRRRGRGRGPRTWTADAEGGWPGRATPLSARRAGLRLAEDPVHRGAADRALALGHAPTRVADRDLTLEVALLPALHAVAVVGVGHVVLLVFSTPCGFPRGRRHRTHPGVAFTPPGPGVGTAGADPDPFRPGRPVHGE